MKKAGDYLNYIIIFIASLLMGLLLSALHLILPWLFGPIIATVLLRKFTSGDYRWPKWLSEVGLYILGAQIGASFTKEIVADIQDELLYIVLMSIFVIVLAIMNSYVLKHFLNCSLETAILASIPGALNQMIVMAEENKHANLLVVTLAQTSRILIVVMIVPFISSLLPEGNHHMTISRTPSMMDAINLPTILLLIGAMVIAGYIFRRIHFPVPDMMGPITVLMIWNLTTGINFMIPTPLIILAQMFFGIRIGLQLYDLSYQINRQLFIGVLVQNLLLITGTFIIVYLMNLFMHESFNDLFLSAAPGGMAQIIIVGLETGANVAMISSYHIFRIFIILLVVTPLLSIYLKYRTRYT
ncbi:AbrB family transcriptional regulator [Macrococcoides canis]|uniref:AbrB family transcriptional regulator n=1 Tax=Macrococcoides canis TaxID=1855823 RepID=UPI0020B8E8FD|nr:AbrB family transcriptional regulator [Macrococcus canis]UTH10754.1 AbrB family transcriptional regulator [Macrococcus canis]